MNHGTERVSSISPGPDERRACSENLIAYNSTVSDKIAHNIAISMHATDIADLHHREHRRSQIDCIAAQELYSGWLHKWGLLEQREGK